MKIVGTAVNTEYFSSINELDSHFKSNYIEERLPANPASQVRWVLVHPESLFDGNFMIYPSKPSSLLFRGQNKRHKPCHPAIFRNVTVNGNTMSHLSTTDQALVTLNLIRTAWFNHNLRQTTAMQWLSGQRVIFDDTALAQHYGMPTSYIDLSESFAVSSFFACCKFDSTSRNWRAVQEGEGVIYTIDRTKIPINGPIKPICLQPFPRPCEQWGWVHKIVLGEDFDIFPHVRKYVFKHNSAASQRILKQFNYGLALFPPDPLSEVADRIMQSNEIPLTVAMAVVENEIDDRFELPNQPVQKLLCMIERKMNVTFSKSCDMSVMNSQIIEKMNTNWEQRKISFTRNEGVGIKLVRTIK